MKNITKKYYCALLIIGISLLVFVFCFTYARCDLIRERNVYVKNADFIINDYKELAKDYKSAVIYALNFKGHVSARQGLFYQSDANEVLTDILKLRNIAGDMESRLRMDTLKFIIDKQLEWFLKPSKMAGHVSNEEDSELNAILNVQEIIDRGESHQNLVATLHRQQLDNAFTSLYGWLVTLISLSASLIIGVVYAIIRQIKRGRFHIQKIGLQKNRLDEIAWIQSHKVRAQVATILGWIQLFNYTNSSDPINHEILFGVKEATQKLDSIIREIDEKTRVSM